MVLERREMPGKCREIPGGRREEPGTCREKPGDDTHPCSAELSVYQGPTRRRRQEANLRITFGRKCARTTTQREKPGDAGRKTGDTGRQRDL